MKIKVSKLTCMSLAVAALSLHSCGSKQQAPQATAPSLAVLTVQNADSELNHNYPATIKGKTDIAIRPQVTGFITKVHVDEGQAVHKGQVLLQSTRCSIRLPSIRPRPLSTQPRQP